MHIENLSNRAMECQYFIRTQKLPLASELGQGKPEAVPAEGIICPCWTNTGGQP